MSVQVSKTEKKKDMIGEGLIDMAKDTAMSKLKGGFSDAMSPSADLQQPAQTTYGQDDMSSPAGRRRAQITGGRV